MDASSTTADRKVAVRRYALQVSLRTLMIGIFLAGIGFAAFGYWYRMEPTALTIEAPEGWGVHFADQLAGTAPLRLTRSDLKKLAPDCKDMSLLTGDELVDRHPCGYVLPGQDGLGTLIWISAPEGEFCVPRETPWGTAAAWQGVAVESGRISFDFLCPQGSRPLMGIVMVPKVVKSTDKEIAVTIRLRNGSGEVFRTTQKRVELKASFWPYDYRRSARQYSEATVDFAEIQPGGETDLRFQLASPQVPGNYGLTVYLEQPTGSDNSKWPTIHDMNIIRIR